MPKRPDSASCSHSYSRSVSFTKVAGLSWFEKKACAAIIAAPPESTYEETLEQFLKVGALPLWSVPLH